METIDFTKEPADIITAIKNDKTKSVPLWADLEKEYNPKKHDIVTDVFTRKDKTKADGTVEKVARVTYGLQKLSAKRMTQMSFAIPVKRVYKTEENPEKKKMAAAIEAVYSKARIDSENNKRMNAYFSACEVATIWFPVPEKNKIYGFDSAFKLRCITYSPMNSKFSRISEATLYPVFDKYKDMIGFAFEYVANEEMKDVTYFHIYTKDIVRIFKSDGVWKDVTGEALVSIGKIPCVYLWRSMPIWEDITGNVNEIELSLSRESDILRKNSAPILKVKGKLKGDKPAGEVAREVYQLDGDGDIDYATWEQQIDAMKFYVETLKQNTEEELQLPNLSFNNVKDISAITEGARKTLLTDAHLKVGDESGDIIEFLSRECNVIKAFLSEMNSSWKNKIMELEVEHIITPYIQNDDSTRIDTITKATQKPIMSQKTGVEKLGMVDDVDKEVQALQEEEKQSNAVSLFETAPAE